MVSGIGGLSQTGFRRTSVVVQHLLPLGHVETVVIARVIIGAGKTAVMLNGEVVL